MKYSKEEKQNVFEYILQEIESGRAVRNVLKDKNTPSSSTFFKWIDEDANLAKLYARACETRGDAKFESIENDYNEEPQRDPETGKIDTGWVQLQRLKIDTKKWEASKLNPKKYGDRVQSEVINKNIDLSNLSEEEYKRKLEIAKRVIDAAG